MGGTPAASSVEGAGTTFRFEVVLPWAAEDEHGSASAGRTLADGRILVLSDNDAAAEVLVRSIEGWEATAVHVTATAAARAAVDRAARRGEPFDTVVMDVTAGADHVAFARDVNASNPSPLRWIALADLGSVKGEVQAAPFVATLRRPLQRTALWNALNRAAVDCPAVDRPQIDAGPMERARILVIDDNVINRRLAVAQLKRLGFAADTLGDGGSAIDAILAGGYELVFMDCQMPGIDGSEATRRIRAAESPLARVRIVALTASALAGDREACLDAGMDDYLSKPTSLDDLRRGIDARFGSVSVKVS